MRIVIVGGGFAGVKSALELSKNPDLSVTLISDKDHFLYYPSLYATATGGTHLESVVPLTKIFRNHSVKLVIDTIERFDPTRKVVASKRHDYQYDTLVLALGVVTSYFGIPGLPEYSYGIKSRAEVDEFKAHLHDELVKDHHMDKHYVVVGAGPTGVELSAALTTYLDRIATNHTIRHGKISIQLVEAAPRVLPRMSERASAKVERHLKQLGVKVMTNKKVEAQDDDSIEISGRDYETQTVVWTSGVSNHPFFKQYDHFFQFAPNGKVIVDEYLKAGDNVFVIGDNAATAFSGLAQTALHDALFVSRTINALYRGVSPKPYHAVKPPVVVPVGHNWAILEWHGIVVTGRIASWIRRAADLIGYHDILPIGQALGVWRAEKVREETCDICSGKA